MNENQNNEARNEALKCLPIYFLEDNCKFFLIFNKMDFLSCLFIKIFSATNEWDLNFDVRWQVKPKIIDLFINCNF